MTVWTSTVDSPVGPLDLVANDDGALTHVLFRDEEHIGPLVAGLRPDTGPFVDVVEQIEEYFAGDRIRFDLPIAPEGTAFQRAAWAALRDIPYGETRSYAAQARAIGHPTAVRAVGAANGRNPLAIVVPCHRVVGANGSLTGFGGGVDRKRWLLAHEQRERALF